MSSCHMKRIRSHLEVLGIGTYNANLHYKGAMCAQQEQHVQPIAADGVVLHQSPSDGEQGLMRGGTPES